MHAIVSDVNSPHKGPVMQKAFPSRDSGIIVGQDLAN